MRAPGRPAAVILAGLGVALIAVLVVVLAAGAGESSDAAPGDGQVAAPGETAVASSVSTRQRTATVAPSPTVPSPAPTPGTPTPGAASGPSVITGPSAVVAMSIPAASVSSSSPVEIRDTFFDAGVERFQDPSHPSRIAYYQRFGIPGSAGTNAVFAAHINYVNYGNGPFAHLAGVPAGSALSVTLATGQVLDYTVSSVQVIPLSQLDMNQVVFPALPPGAERVTLISCGGTFVPNPSGVGGEYNSRVILVADRVAG